MLKNDEFTLPKIKATVNVLRILLHTVAGLSALDMTPRYVPLSSGLATALIAVAKYTKVNPEDTVLAPKGSSPEPPLISNAFPSAGEVGGSRGIDNSGRNAIPNGDREPQFSSPSSAP